MRLLKFLVLGLLAWNCSVGVTTAQNNDLGEPAEFRYYTTRVDTVAPQEMADGGETDTVLVEMTVIAGKDEGQKVTALWSNDIHTSRTFPVEAGDKLIVSCIVLEGNDQCSIMSQVRSAPIAILVIIFAVVVYAIARGHGLRSLLTMGIGLAVITLVIIPLILKGLSPLLVTIIGGLIIIVPTIYISHGFHAKSHIALSGIILASIMIGVLSLIFSHLLYLNGSAIEEAMYLNQTINLRAILLSAILLGALGVIDDLALTQVSIVNELYHSNKSLSLQSLFARAMKIGRDHISSVVNTLFLAYVGVSLPLLILVQQNNLPFFVTIQQEQIATEIMRTIVGTIGLILVVPFTTYIAALLITRYPERFPEESHHHVH